MILLLQKILNIIIFILHTVILLKVKKFQKIKILECFYGDKFLAGIEKDNFFGLQFHPEKSQLMVLKFLKIL